MPTLNLTSRNTSGSGGKMSSLDGDAVDGLCVCEEEGREVVRRCCEEVACVGDALRRKGRV